MSAEAERYAKLHALFQAAGGLDGSARKQYLDEQCAGDEGLRAQVEALIATSSLEAPTADPFGEKNIAARRKMLDDVVAGTAARQKPVVSDRYHVIEFLGEGGFGEVWRAEQRAPLRREVAIKVIKPGMDSRAVVARFESERQALAVMDHPGIARVFDAGATDRGRPFVVMELVKGVPITDFCDRHRLTLTGRIELMLRVCSAVQHAHAKGVIHRDLKPGNVLVGFDGDGVAQPKVIDFGVAKALSARLTEATFVTERGQFIGTPAYMSPEQAEMTELDIDTRSDIYSLGVLLYELLTGMLPFDARTLQRAGFEEIRRIIRDVDPPRPSTRIGTLLGDADLETGSRIAEARSINCRQLRSELKRDLDWIVVRCLEKNRERRYASASALADELRRYLDGEAILAGPPSAAYRIGKFVRRRKGPVAAAAVIALLLIGGAAVSTVFAIRATDAETLAEERADLAERRAYVANIVAADAALAAGRPSFDVRRQLDLCGEPMRRWEWEWLRARSDQSIRTYEYPRSDVHCAALHPNDRWLAVGGVDPANAMVLDLVSGETVAKLPGHGGWVSGMAFSPDGELLVTSCTDALGRLWKSRTGELVAVLGGHTEGVSAVACSPDGSTILTGSSDGTVRVFDGRTGAPGPVLEGHGRHGVYVGFSPDGRRAVSCGEDYRARVRNVSDWSVIADAPVNEPAPISFGPGSDTMLVCNGNDATVWDIELDQPRLVLPHAAWVMMAAMSPDGSTIVTADSNGQLRIFDGITGALLNTWRWTAYDVTRAKFSPDGRRMLAIAGDASVGVWSLRENAPMAVLRRPSSGIGTALFMADSNRIVTCAQSVQLWDPQVSAEAIVLRGHQAAIHTGRYTPDGSRIVTLAQDESGRLWDAASGALLAVLPGIGRSGDVAIDRDGGRFVTGGEFGLGQTWSAVDGRPLATLTGHTGEINTVAICPEGTWVATASQDGTARLWDASTGTPLSVLTGHDGPVADVAASPDSSRLVTAGRDGTARLWTADGAAVATMRASESAVNRAVFDPSGRHVVTGAEDGRIAVWNAESGALIREVIQPHKAVHTIELSPDGKTLLAAGDRSASLHDFRTGETLFELAGHTDFIEAAAFSPDGARVVTCSHDQTVRVWDVATGAQLVVLLGHAGVIHDVVFSPDGRQILSVGAEGLGRIVDNRSTAERAAAMARWNGQLDAQSQVIAQRLEQGASIDAVRDSLGGLGHARDLECRAGLAVLLAGDPGGQANELNRRAWLAVRFAAPGEGGAGDRRAALEAARSDAQRAVLLAPWDGNILNTLGAAQYRLGQLEEAVESLLASEELLGREEPSNWAFLAMAYRALGRDHLAEEALERFKRLANERLGATPEEVHRWFDELGVDPPPVEAADDSQGAGHEANGQEPPSF